MGLVCWENNEGLQGYLKGASARLLAHGTAQIMWTWPGSWVPEFSSGGYGDVWGPHARERKVGI